MSLTPAEKQTLNEGMMKLFDLSVKVPSCLNNYRAGVCDQGCKWLDFCVLTTKTREGSK